MGSIIGCKDNDSRRGAQVTGSRFSAAAGGGTARVAAHAGAAAHEGEVAAHGAGIALVALHLGHVHLVVQRRDLSVAVAVLVLACPFLFIVVAIRSSGFTCTRSVLPR